MWRAIPRDPDSNPGTRNSGAPTPAAGSQCPREERIREVQDQGVHDRQHRHSPLASSCLRTTGPEIIFTSVELLCRRRRHMNIAVAQAAGKRVRPATVVNVKKSPLIRNQESESAAYNPL